jgi:glucokinase
MARARDLLAGVDMGGTSIRALIVDGQDQVLALSKTPTRPSQSPSALIAEVASCVEKLIETTGRRRDEVRAVSIGTAGSIDPERGIVHNSPNLGWKDVPLGKELKGLLRLPVFVENDVNVGLLGEHALGAGKGADDVFGIFVGTGIGGGIICGGRLYTGSSGSAGEIGHTVLLVNGPLCGCGHHGCAEALASRTAMERDVRGAIECGRKSVVLEIMEKRGKTRMTSSVIQAALKKDDKVMREVVERAAYYLGILAANVINLLDPERVVIGGGIVERLGEDFVKPIRKTASEYVLRADHAEGRKIVAGTLGDNAGALGAVVLARQKLRTEAA